jgi:hyperosmotically inducible periplasmic protein
MQTRNFLKILSALFLAVFLAACASTSTESSTGDLIDDTVITARIKAAYAKDPMVSALAVSVESFKGAVQLSGFVKTAAERARAEAIANDVPGVTQVFNSIQLR